jgi:hypothetical protein
VWHPFWQSLTDAERDAYLVHWQATADWRDALAFYVTPDSPEFDATADARESSEMLARLRKSRPSRQTLWQRLFGPKS